jgi:trk system potassium uptake protein TrkA
VAVTDLIGEVIEREVVAAQLERLTLLGGGNLSLIEVEVPAGMSDRMVRDLSLPVGTLLVTLIDGGEVLVPGGETVIHPGNRVVAVTTLDQEPDVREAICGTDP